jgi:flagellar hook-length control protein FliK
MTAIALGGALFTNEVPAAEKEPSLPQSSLAQASRLPTPALPGMPIQFGEQLRQSMEVDSVTEVPGLAVRMTSEAMPAELSNADPSSDSTEETDRQFGDGLTSFPGLITFTQPVVVPLEYAAQTRDGEQPRSQPMKSSQAVAAVLQLQQGAPRENTLLNVFSGLPETSAPGALTINPAAVWSASNVAQTGVSSENQTSLATAHLASFTNVGLAQAMVEGMAQQPGVLKPVEVQMPQPLNTQRSALEAALGDRLQLQITQRSEHAVIRLDPPSMGTIEIVIQREVGGSLQVYLRASNAEVARQLHGIGDSLRQDLVNRQHADVSVHVSDGSREHNASQQGQRQHAQRQVPGRALSEFNEESLQSFTLAVDEERGA